ncbi:MAG TPA: DNA-processing protein DprA [Chloroflexota bacterium]|nr:DNA-processing protein DprA [Chloroflexota bacterium]
MTDAERAHWVALLRVSGLGPVKFGRLLEGFGSATGAWQAASSELRAAGLDARTIEALLAFRRGHDPLLGFARFAQHGIEAVTLLDAQYPPLLKEIYAPPPVLFLRGTVLPDDQLALAVVGTRGATAYGRLVTERFVAELVEHGVTIVSGLALGIDAVAHRAALQHGGRTIAVLGSGVDTIYPSNHRGLADSILRNGALLSEYAPGTKPERDNFPARNRLIAGMTRGTLVVEAGEVSGALITVRMALEQNREVFAVPGNVTSAASVGTNALLRAGEAKLVARVEDILEELNPGLVVEQLRLVDLLPDNEMEAVLLRALSAEPLHVDDLSRATSLPVATVSSTLTMLELKGSVTHAGGMVYARAR